MSANELNRDWGERAICAHSWRHKRLKSASGTCFQVPEPTHLCSYLQTSSLRGNKPGSVESLYLKKKTWKHRKTLRVRFSSVPDAELMPQGTEVEGGSLGPWLVGSLWASQQILLRSKQSCFTSCGLWLMNEHLSPINRASRCSYFSQSHWLTDIHRLPKNNNKWGKNTEIVHKMGRIDKRKIILYFIIFFGSMTKGWV